MEKKKTSNFMSFFTKNRKLVFILLYIIILPIITLTVVYSITYLNGRPKIFKQTVDSKEEFTSVSKFKDYTKSKYVELNPSLDFTAPVYNHKDKTVTSSGKFDLKFAPAFKNKEIKYIDNSGKINVEADTYWKSFKLGPSERTLYKDSKWDTERSFSSVSIYFTLNNYMPARPLLFIKVNERDFHFYIKFSFKIQSPRPNETEEIVEYLKISPSQWKKMIY